MRAITETAALDAETRALERPRDHTSELRLWLRMLACTNMIETEIRRRLRERFDVTLPRFDLMAQLDKAPEGLSLGEISRRMMVSNGNVTGLVERLTEDGLVERRASDTDRRSTFVRLTPDGRAAFRQMADEHADWIGELFGDLSADDIEVLLDQLGQAKASVLSHSKKGEGAR
ncbi:MarR family winged helix-turn-helix transcriptional regulator [Amorphus sp. 3PC139-8]|uniref:MarR family winged helix-turn-helix transcriptional regulator n=1 Tax=Amorphus sp. 3PC139-8 TaxID=2735676 RepID=UPI00345D0952